jgi:hypothetical protein
LGWLPHLKLEYLGDNFRTQSYDTLRTYNIQSNRVRKGCFTHEFRARLRQEDLVYSGIKPRELNCSSSTSLYEVYLALVIKLESIDLQFQTIKIKYSGKADFFYVHSPKYFLTEMIDCLLSLGIDTNAIQIENHPEQAQKFGHHLGTDGRKGRVADLPGKKLTLRSGARRAG